MKEILVNAVITLSAIVLTTIVTYLSTVKKERKQQVNKYRLEILEKLYTPIYRIYYQSVIPTDGYEGIGSQGASSIVNIVENNIELADPVLEELIWGLKEEMYIMHQAPSVYQSFDENRELLEHINYHYNLLRKQLNLPYDYAYFSFSETRRVKKGNRLRRKKRVKALKILRNHIEEKSKKDKSA